MTRKAHASERAQAGLAALLAAVAGYVDAYAVLNYKVFVSFMSGNTTRTAWASGREIMLKSPATRCRFRVFSSAYSSER